MKKVKIANKEFPVKFSFQALNELCELRQCSLAELDELADPDKVKPIDILFLAFAGLKEGARREGKELKLTMDQVDDLLSSDMAAIGRIMDVYANQNAQPAENPTTPPKKKAGSTKKPQRKK